MPDSQRPMAIEPVWCQFACPFCKSDLDLRDAGTPRCRACGGTFPRVDGIIDFRRHYPAGVPTPPAWDEWVEGQRHYEQWASSLPGVDVDFEAQRSLSSLYRELLPMGGRVLDVAGGFGAVRDVLSEADQYLSIDPWVGAPRHLASRQAHVEARFPRMQTPVPFVAGHAEWLPLAPSTFDWVHMRSCLDHFLDPFLALREAWRVLVPGGHLAVGVAALGGTSAVMEPGAKGLAARVVRKLRSDGLRGAARRAYERLSSPDHDAHLWHPSLSNLQTLMTAAGFVVEEWRWQDPPEEHCVYLRGGKPSGAQDAT